MIYEYECHKCKQITEYESSVKNRPELVSCIWCGEEADRVFSVPNKIATPSWES